MPEATQTRPETKLTLASEALRLGHSIRLGVLGTSMLPTIWPGDVLQIEAKSAEHVGLGDIVLLARNGRFFVHRVVGSDHNRNGCCFVTRGDCLPASDLPCRKTEILGRVVAIKRDGRVITSMQRSVWNRMAAGVLSRSATLVGLALRVRTVRMGESRTRRLVDAEPSY